MWQDFEGGSHSRLRKIEHRRRSVEQPLVGSLAASHGTLDHFTHARSLRPHVAPVAAFGYLEAVVLGERGVGHIAARLLEGLLKLLVVDIGDALEEEQREDKLLIIARVNNTPEERSRAPEIRFKSLLGNSTPRIVHKHFRHVGSDVEAAAIKEIGEVPLSEVVPI